MDLSSIPTNVLQAEHAAVDRIQHFSQFLMATPLCDYLRSDRVLCHHCPAADDCNLLSDGSPGWPERKERYLLAIRAELASRISPNSSEEVVAK